MDTLSIVIVTFGALLALVLLILAALILPGRSYTQLLELIASVGSRAEANGQAIQQVQTILSDVVVPVTTSVQKAASPTTPDNPQP